MELKNKTKNNSKKNKNKKKQHLSHRGYSVSMTLCAWILHFIVHFLDLIVVTLKLDRLQMVQETKLHFSFISLEIRIPYHINVLFRYI